MNFFIPLYRENRNFLKNFLLKGEFGGKIGLFYSSGGGQNLGKGQNSQEIFRGEKGDIFHPRAALIRCFRSVAECMKNISFPGFC